MKKWIMPVVLVIVLLSLVFEGIADKHHTNAKYLMWKHGWVRYDPTTALRYLNVDVRFRESLRGKTKYEVKKWFPCLRSMSEANDYQQYYNQYLKDVDFLWTGESAWGIEFKNNRLRLKEFRLMKG